MTTKKAEFITAVQEISTVLARTGPQFQWLFETYFDRGYNNGGANPLVDIDFPPELGITAGDVAAFITLAENVGNLLESRAVFVSDYGATLNRLRVDI